MIIAERSRDFDLVFFQDGKYGRFPIIAWEIKEGMVDPLIPVYGRHIEAECTAVLHVLSGMVVGFGGTFDSVDDWMAYVRETETPTLHGQDAMTLGKAVLLCRRERGLSQLELGLRTDAGAPYICRLEQDKLNPTLSTIRKVAKELNIPLALLFFLAADRRELVGLDPSLQAMVDRATLAMLREAPA